MRRLLVILGILFVGFLYSHIGEYNVRAIVPEECSIEQSSPEDQQSVIRDFMFINSECAITAQTASCAMSRIPTRTISQNLFQRYLLLIKRTGVQVSLKVFAVRSTIFFKRLPYSNNYFIYFLKRIIC